MNIKCPRCGNKNTAPIMYGMPAYDEELEQAIADHKIVLGGCCISDSDPKYYCFQCRKKFGTPSILKSKHGKEKYEDIITSIRFSDGGFFDGYPEILIKKENYSIMIDARPGFSLDGILHREMTEKEWKRIIAQLYEKLYIHEWKKRYDNPFVLDGEQWELEIHLSKGRKRLYYGSNAYPALWEELKSVFRPFFKEAGIKL